ncbi:unnamed protein product [Gemmataceae bacterium]|nr:unnamed protein product [Gemmataceae bacterium]VTT98916.1 unnamed protein product [Gemmataceae bacterium]
MAKDKEPAPAPEPRPVGEQLLDLVGRATPDDLKAIDDAIAAKDRDLAALRAVRKVLAVAAGVEEPKKPGPGPRKEKADADQPGRGGSMEERRVRCARYILKNGPTPAAGLGRLFDIPAGSQTGVLSHPWFQRTDSGVDLTAVGRAAVQKQIDD